MSKGDKPRPVDKKRFDMNWEKIFRKDDNEAPMPDVRRRKKPRTRGDRK